MLFVNFAGYADDRDLVERVRPAHRAYVEALRVAGRFVIGGPFADDTGALLIYAADSRADVDRMIAEDPYQVEGVYLHTEVAEWHPAGANRDAVDTMIQNITK
jgi:uncharacterized protein